MCTKLFLVCYTIVLFSKNVCALLEGHETKENGTDPIKRSIPKCCESDKYLNSSSLECVFYDKSYDFTNINITIHDRYNYDTVVSKTFKSLFYAAPGKMNEFIVEANTTFAENYPFNPAEYDLKTYFTEIGELYLELANAYDRWTLVSHFCIDYVIDMETEEAKPEFLCVFLASSNTEGKTQSYYFYYIIVSSIFLILVLLVYILLPELRNLGGMILMAYVTSLLAGFIVLAVMQSFVIEQNECINYTATIYFFLLATFFWMNVMSVDIWWTFRGYAKARPIHRRGERFKFLMYCLYAWGVPAAMTIALVILNESDLSDMPWIIKPMVPKAGCFIQGGQKLVYLYIPMMILILSNWLFFLMTAYNIRRLMRGNAVLNTAAAGNPVAHQQQRNRLMVYLKLSVIMGINWLLEVVSFLTPDLPIWVISDTYNLLIGLAIFLIFVCKKKILRKLAARLKELRAYWSGGPRPTRTLTKISTSSSTLESNLSQDIPLQVSPNPMPDAKPERKHSGLLCFQKKEYKL